MTEDTLEVNDELSKNAMGGTELMRLGLQKHVPADLLDQFQIIPSRVRELDPDKYRILWCHDLAEDPEAEAALSHDGWKNFHKIVFVSNWQMQRFIEKYNLPWSHCIVLKNAIEPIEDHKKPARGPIRIIYPSTPHRGLNILVAVFERISEELGEKKAILDVYSSFELYGWPERDKQFEPLFDRIREHPAMNYHGSVDNSMLRDAYKKSHILAYPSIWQETSCMVLMEAMSAGLVCIHPNYAALFETGAGLTWMYQWHEDLNVHAGIMYNLLKAAIESYRDKDQKDQILSKCGSNVSYANALYSWNSRSADWISFLQAVLQMPKEIPDAPAFKKDSSSLVLPGNKDFPSHITYEAGA